MKVKVWADSEDVTELDVPERSDAHQVIRTYCERTYDEGWSDFVQIYLQTEKDSAPRAYNVAVSRSVTFDVSKAQ